MIVQDDATGSWCASGSVHLNCVGRILLPATLASDQDRQSINAQRRKYLNHGLLVYSTSKPGYKLPCYLRQLSAATSSQQHSTLLEQRW